jgi:hypothetical protein
MHAFSFKHKLLLHKEGLPLAPHRASFAIKIENGSLCRVLIMLEENYGARRIKIVYLLERLRRIMPWQQREGQQTFVK